MRMINNIVLTDPLSDDDDLREIPVKKTRGKKEKRGRRRPVLSAETPAAPEAAENAPDAEAVPPEAEAVPAAGPEPEADTPPAPPRPSVPVQPETTALPPVPPLPETPPQPVFATVSVRRRPKKKAGRPKGKVSLREVRPDDAAALAEIYEYYVRRTAITFETEAPDAAEFRRRIEEITVNYPFLVAERSGEIVGYAYAAPFKARAAYACSVEISVYLRRSATRQGIGRMLYEELEFLLKERAFVNAYACIAYPNAEDRYLDRGSVAFHEAMGYRLCGVFENCAVKFDTWYSMIWMGKQL